MKDNTQAIANIQQLIDAAIPFAARTGIRLLDFERGYVRMCMPFESNTNHVGTMYAGALFTLAEIPGGVLVLGAFDMSKYFPVIADIHLEFKKPATTDITVEARLSDEEIARITHDAETHGKAAFNLSLKLLDAHNEVVALSSGNYQMRLSGL